MSKTKSPGRMSKYTQIK